LTTLGCTTATQEGVIEVRRIQYDVPVKNDDPTAFWWANNLEGSVREEVLKTLFDKAYAGEIEVYDYFHNPMTPGQVRNVGRDTVYKTLRREYAPYDEYDTMVVTSISFRDVSALRFLEEWQINRDNMTVEKKVLGLGPVYIRDYGTDKYRQLLFWTYFDERFPETLKGN
jgi:hypothetical protein